jgi:ABC-type bacteriocin/lantibiotic exporter with double-glycine peptidase domain
MACLLSSLVGAELARHNGSAMPKVIPRLPSHSRSCGPVCIKMAADYFGLPYSLAYIDEVSRARERGGLTNDELIRTLRRLGFAVRPRVRGSWQDLRTLNTAGRLIILAWMLEGYRGHFSVLDRATSEHIYIADPEVSGVRRLPKHTFMRLWFDYDNIAYPRTRSDISLRWMALVSRKC